MQALKSVPCVVTRRSGRVAGAQDAARLLTAPQVEQNGNNNNNHHNNGDVTPSPGELISVMTLGGVVDNTVPLSAVYPPPLATHQEVVASKELFLDTLDKFHTALGTRLLARKGRKGKGQEAQSFRESLEGIPKIGGKALDLHFLYVEVTSRGGSHQVIKDRKWKELTVGFNFPHTTSSAAYVLRKYYIGILHHYEQVYFFRIQGRLVPPPIALPGPSPVSVTRDQTAHPLLDARPETGKMGQKIVLPSLTLSESLVPPPLALPEPSPLSASRVLTVQPLREVGSDTGKAKKRKLLPIQALPVMDPSVSIGHVVTGAIEGKFEHGYLISIMMGTEKLRGVLYHVPPGDRGLQNANVPSYDAAFGAEQQIPSREIPIVKSSGHKHAKRKKDPNAPRANRSGYNFYFGEQHLILKALHPNKEREMNRMIGEAWNRLTDEEKLPYQEQALKDKQRFQKEMQEYQESLKIYDEVTPAGSLPLLELNRGNEEKQSEETMDDIRDQQLEIMVAKLEEAFGNLPHEPNSSSAAVSEHEDSPLHDLPE